MASSKNSATFSRDWGYNEPASAADVASVRPGCDSPGFCGGHSRLSSVRRLVACALVQALVVSTAAGTSLHVHEYLGHDHPEHHHGPASHEHHHAAIADDDHHDDTEDHDLPALQADSCDPAQHAVAVRMGCAQVPPLHVDVAELPGPPILVPAVPVQSVAPVTDVRVHGPPFDSRIPVRAPPFTPQA
jgi:hypothetical protein